jgi:ribosomal protein L29
MNWHYIKNITRKPRVVIPKNVFGTNKNLFEFTNNTEEAKSGEIVGRAWRANELRLKSKPFLPTFLTFLSFQVCIINNDLDNSDLHKLWYVLLKEKNRLLGDRLLTLQLNQQFSVHNNLRKVRLSMSRLLTVVNERKKLRDTYRQYLEDQYINEKKLEEARERIAKVLTIR